MKNKIQPKTGVKLMHDKHKGRFTSNLPDVNSRYTRCIHQVYLKYKIIKTVIKKIKKMENSNNRNITLSIKVTAEQKAKFTKIATKHNISLSEWSASILEINKDSYDKIGDPTLRESALEDKVRKQEQQIKRLEAKLESADHKVQVELIRADNAIERRDASILNLKKMQSEYSKLKVEFDEAILQNKNQEKTALGYNDNKAIILPTIGLASLIFGLLLRTK